MIHVENAIVFLAYCLQYGSIVLVVAAGVGLLISGLDWFMDIDL